MLLEAGLLKQTEQKFEINIINFLQAKRETGICKSQLEIMGMKNIRD